MVDRLNAWPSCVTDHRFKVVDEIVTCDIIMVIILCVIYFQIYYGFQIAYSKVHITLFSSFLFIGAVDFREVLFKLTYRQSWNILTTTSICPRSSQRLIRVWFDVRARMSTLNGNLVRMVSRPIYRSHMFREARSLDWNVYVTNFTLFFVICSSSGIWECIVDCRITGGSEKSVWARPGHPTTVHLQCCFSSYRRSFRKA